MQRAFDGRWISLKSATIQSKHLFEHPKWSYVLVQQTPKNLNLNLNKITEFVFRKQYFPVYININLHDRENKNCIETWEKYGYTSFWSSTLNILLTFRAVHQQESGDTHQNTGVIRKEIYCDISSFFFPRRVSN